MAAPTNPSFFETTSLDAEIASTVADVRDFERLATVLGAAKPEIVLHLAAQPLVRRAFANPVETYGTNVMGTVNLLEALRLTESVRAAVIVTTDKVYENREWAWGYRESDALGGREPYGNSKACAEFAVSAFCRSYFSDGGGSDRRGKPGVERGGFEEAGIGRRGEGVAVNLGPEAGEGQAEPAAHETGVAGDEYPPAGPEAVIYADSRHSSVRQVYQGASPLSHSSFRSSISRGVSMHCQKPGCW